MLAASAALCIGLAKSGLPGVGIFPILLLASIMPARESTGTLLPMLICGDFLALLTYREHAQWHHVGRVLPAAFIGIILGYLAMPLVSDRWFGPLIGGVVLTMVIVQILRKRLRLAPAAGSRIVGWSTGIFSGITTMMANAAGPIMSIYLLAMGLPKLAFVGTSASFFLLINVLKVPFSAHLGLINSTSLKLNLVLLPVIGLGVLSGRLLIQRIPQRAFELLVLVFAAFAAVRLLFS